MLPKQARETSRKHVTKPFTQPAAPDCNLRQFLAIGIHPKIKYYIICALFNPAPEFGSSKKWNHTTSTPSFQNLIACLELLYALGAIDDAGALTRPLGENMCELPVHPTVAKMLLGSGDFGCSQEIAVIVAMLQVHMCRVNIRADGKSQVRQCLGFFS